MVTEQNLQTHISEDDDGHNDKGIKYVEIANEILTVMFFFYQVSAAVVRTICLLNNVVSTAFDFLIFFCLLGTGPKYQPMFTQKYI